MSVSSVDESTTRASIASPVPQSSVAGPNRATPSPPAARQDSADSYAASTSTSTSTGDDVRNEDGQQGAGKLQCAVAGEN